ncbi:type II secretion system minor pseudopilin GspK [Candidatus Colwellia aromaticivorans]|uniref:type II secretion system minor pseudopilin GspK n=1 Tax=Candidatus Colwellia aromaticivorans TaxID=2267621 RepID=UPI000DF47C02|nr:type II secretion system minor pseudopilin GspK [Candidatus Colwellia aromaticivorans]
MSVSLSKYHKQKGVALITVMLIVALCAVIASQMTARLQMQMQRSANITFNQQAYWYAMGAEAFTKRVLITAFKKDEDVTHLGQVWAQGEITYPVDFGEISGEILDLQSCLNLNALRAPLSNTGNVNAANNKPKSNDNKVPARLAFETLLINLQLEGISQFEAESMADSLTDWLDENSRISGSGGAEDDDYASREFPYLAANNFLASVNELRVVAHFTPAIINGIKPYVCVIPDSDQHKININTITAERPELLQALLDSTLEEAEQILSVRGDKGFDAIEDFYNLPEVIKLKNSDSNKDQFVVDSEYFTLKASASFNNSFFVMNSVMKITNNKHIDVISRTIGRN